MRILHVIHSDAFYGVERYVATLAVAQAEMGDEVAVVGGSSAAMTVQLRASNVRFAPGGSVLDVALGLRTFRGADVVHAHMTDAELAATALLPLVSPQSRVVATRHFAQRRGASRTGRLVAPFIARQLDAEVAISKFVADRIEGPSRIIYPAVPEPVTAAVSRKSVVLVAQRLEAEKATDLALEAFALSGLAHKGWQLQIAGSGSLRPALERLSLDLGIARAVDFLGRRDDVPDLMASAGMLLATPPSEPFGLTVVEAMAAGLPVVASIGGGHAESLPAAALEHGFATGAAQGAAAALQHLAADWSLRESLSVAGRSRYERLFTPQAQAEATRNLYAELLQVDR